MLEKLLKPFTSPTMGGVSTRYLTVIITTALSVLSLVGILDKEQAEFFKTLTPEFVGAISTIVLTITTAYAILKKSHSPTAEAVAKTVDAGLPPKTPIVVSTPIGQPDIVIQKQ